MRKIYNIFLAINLIILIHVLEVKLIDVNVDEYGFIEVCYPYDSSNGAEKLGQIYLYDYFYKNRNNFIYNPVQFSCCGFVTIAQLLMYYDTFYNDSIIDDRYVVKTYIDSEQVWSDSPGVKSHSDLLYLYELSGAGAHNNISKIKEIIDDEDSFFGELLTIAINNNLIDNLTMNQIIYFDETTHNSNFDGPIANLRLNINEMHTLVSAYLNYNYNYNVTVTSGYDDSLLSQQNQIRDLVISKIKSGIPVILGLKDRGTNEGHVVVAYYVDENNNIYCHLGERYNGYYFPINNLYSDTVISAYLYLNMVGSHICSSNYITNTNMDLCPHLFSTHQHIYNFLPQTENYHKINCYCGYEMNESHTFVANGLIATCSKCGYLAKHFVPIIKNKKEEELEVE